MNNATPTAALYNTIVSGNSTDIEYGGTVQAQESQLSKQTSIIGASLLGADGSAVSGWSFDPATMLGTLDFHNGGLTESFPLIDNGNNPAVSQGMSADELTATAGEMADVETGFAAVDQNGQTRTGNSIGSYAL